MSKPEKIDIRNFKTSWELNDGSDDPYSDMNLPPDINPNKIQQLIYPIEKQILKDLEEI